MNQAERQALIKDLPSSRTIFCGTLYREVNGGTTERNGIPPCSEGLLRTQALLRKLARTELRACRQVPR